MLGKNRFALLLLSLSLTVASACASKGGPADGEADVKPSEDQQPVELTWYFASATTSTPEELKATYEKPIKSKYPHISIKFVNNKDETAMANIVASRTKIDLIYASFNVFNTVKQHGLLGNDIADLIAKHKFDTNRVETAYIELFKSLNEGKLAGLPLFDIRRVLFYNKDIFDKFAVPYPKDGMTWEETLDLAQRLTRVDGGVQYRGLVIPPSGFVPTNQYALPFVDPKTKKAALQTDGWKKFLDTYVPFYTMPGYNPTKELLGSKQEELFFNEKSAAMLVKFNSDAGAVNASLTNWDVASFPEVSTMRGVGSQPYPVYLGMSSTIDPKHRDAAFLVMEHLLSDEMQKELTASGGLATPLKSQEVKAVFAQNQDAWKGKNIKAVTAQKPAAPVPYHEYNRFGQSATGNALVSVILGEKDVNTALREAEELMNKQIAEEEAKK